MYFLFLYTTFVNTRIRSSKSNVVTFIGLLTIAQLKIKICLKFCMVMSVYSFMTSENAILAFKTFSGFRLFGFLINFNILDF